MDHITLDVSRGRAGREVQGSGPPSHDHSDLGDFHKSDDKVLR